MFHTSTQRRCWLLENCECIAEGQTNANREYREHWPESNPELEVPEFLAYHEERLFIVYYSHVVMDICSQLTPPAPLSTTGTAMLYFKRFYLNTSVMEFHPKDVAFLCVYLACKVDEHNISIDQFMGQAASDRPEIARFVIDNELLMITKLSFHLTVHSPFRALEGFIVDMRARGHLSSSSLTTARSAIDRMARQSLYTDVALLYPPSQIALAVLRRCLGKEAVDAYVRAVVATSEKLQSTLIASLAAIADILANFQFPSRDMVDAIEEKLAAGCRDLEHDPADECYRAREARRGAERSAQKRGVYREAEEVAYAEQKILAQELIMSVS